MTGQLQNVVNRGTCSFCARSNVYARHFYAAHALKLRDHAHSMGRKYDKNGLGTHYRCIYCSTILQGPFPLANHLDRSHREQLGTLKGIPPDSAPVTNQAPLVVGDTDTATVIETLHQALNERDTTIESLQGVIAKLEVAAREAVAAKTHPVPLSNGASERIMDILRHLRP